MWPNIGPVLLIGYVTLFGGIGSYAPPDNTTQVELRSSLQGPGLYVNGTPSGLVSGGVQWGFNTIIDRDVVLSFIPHLGVSHATEQVHALPSYTQFDVGGGLYTSYEHLVIGIKLSHWSNGNYLFNWSDSAGRQNVGINMAVLQLGWRF